MARFLLTTACLLMAVLSVVSSICAQSGEKREISAAERMKWFVHDKFGMFIHWGPYSMLAGEYQGRRVAVGRNAEWIMNYLKIPRSEYREAAHRFNPVRFDAGYWARLARQAGMKYLVITAKHHDGFAMYRSGVSDYNIVQWTAFGRDPLQELAAECRKEGIRFCVYYSHREDWDHPDAYGNSWDFDPARQNFGKYLEEKSKPQLRELLTNYGPIGLVWFDRGLYTPEQARDFVSIVRTLQPACLVNGRVGNYEQELMGDYQNMSDNGMPPGGVDEYWETPQTLNETWGYSRFDEGWKSPQEVVRRLVEIVSKGGNYLLNIGPTGEGEIPPPSVAVLSAVGQWMERNGESIYGTSASPFLDLPWGRCTVKDRLLYLHVFEWPAGGELRLPGLRSNPRRAWLLDDPGRKLSVRNVGPDVVVGLNGKATDPMDTVIALELAAPPQVDPPVVAADASSKYLLDYITAVTTGKTRKRFNRGGRFHISKWESPEDAASWHIRVDRPGTYRVRMRYAARPEWAGGRYVISVGNRNLGGTVEGGNGWYEYKDYDVGLVTLGKSGILKVTLRPDRRLGHDMLYLQSLSLVPAPQR